MFKNLLVVCVLLFIGGCVGMEVHHEGTVPAVATLPQPERSGVYHKVKKGQTIWRIAKAYNVDVDDIIKMNNIPDVAQVEENQLVFIPGADKVKEIVAETKDNDTEFIWPVKGKVVGYFNQFGSDAHMNSGIDIQGTDGQSVKASRSGRVVLADYLTGYGFAVILDHTDGFYTVYGRNAELSVALDDYVHQGDEIAKLGRSNAGTYLHFEIRKNSTEKNPLHYLP